MDLKETTKGKLLFALNMLSGFKLDTDGLEIIKVDVPNKSIVYKSKTTDGEITVTVEELKRNIDLPVLETETDNDMKTSDVIPVGITEISATSDNVESDQNKANETSDVKVGGRLQRGGNKSIFKSSKYSETSSAKYTDISNFSQTSSVNYNGRSDKYSDTSALGQIGGYGDSDASIFIQNGGEGNETSDTLRSISELKDRKKVSSKSNLDIGIFKKVQQQSGGSTNELKKRMMEAGINSSSTSSVCE